MAYLQGGNGLGTADYQCRILKAADFFAACKYHGALAAISYVKDFKLCAFQLAALIAQLFYADFKVGVLGKNEGDEIFRINLLAVEHYYTVFINSEADVLGLGVTGRRYGFNQLVGTGTEVACSTNAGIAVPFPSCQFIVLIGDGTVNLSTVLVDYIVKLIFRALKGNIFIALSNLADLDTDGSVVDNAMIDESLVINFNHVIGAVCANGEEVFSLIIKNVAFCRSFFQHVCTPVEVFNTDCAVANILYIQITVRCC